MSVDNAHGQNKVKIFVFLLFSRYDDAGRGRSREAKFHKIVAYRAQAVRKISCVEPDVKVVSQKVDIDDFVDAADFAFRRYRHSLFAYFKFYDAFLFGASCKRRAVDCGVQRLFIDKHGGCEVGRNNLIVVDIFAFDKSRYDFGVFEIDHEIVFLDAHFYVFVAVVKKF